MSAPSRYPAATGVQGSLKSPGRGVWAGVLRRAGTREQDVQAKAWWRENMKHEVGAEGAPWRFL